MNVSEIREALGTVETKRFSSSFNNVKWNANTAFNRLQIIREMEKYLIGEINKNVNGFPIEIRMKYDKIIDLMKEIEEDEIRTIKFGE